jgi:hypothetical protein
MTPMRILSTLVLLLCACRVQAEIRFELRETISGHPSMVRKTTETTSHMYIRGGKIAKLQNQIVQIVDNENSLLTLIDFRDKKFATSTLGEAERNRDQMFDQNFPQDIRMELISSGEKAEWDGQATKRDVFRIQIDSEFGQGECIYTVDSIAAPPPEFEPTGKAMDATERNYDQELEAEIQTLFFIHTDRFKDIQKARKGESQKSSLLIHSVAEFRLKKGAPLLDAIGQELADQTLMTHEMEVVNFRSSPAEYVLGDPGGMDVFLVPPGFDQVEMHELLVQQDIRANQ